MIKITFPDGSVREYNDGVNGLQTVSYTHLDVYKRKFLVSADVSAGVR